MKKLDFGQFVAIFANIGVIVGIVFLVYELRQNTIATQVAAADGFIQSIYSAGDWIVSDPELADLFVEAQAGAELSDSEQFRLIIIYSNMLRLWHRTFHLHEDGILDEKIWRVQSNEMRININTLSHFRDFWSENRGLYDEGFNGFLDGLLAAGRND